MLDRLRQYLKGKFLGWVALSSLLHVFFIAYIPYIVLSQDNRDTQKQCQEIMEVGLVDKPVQEKAPLKKHNRQVMWEKVPRLNASKLVQHENIPQQQEESEFSQVPYEIEGHVNLDYMARMRRRIMTAWIYPDTAISAGLEGKAKIAFEIDSSGRLLEQGIIQSSGYQDLDRAALLAIQQASPFGCFPADIQENTLKIKWYFQYKLD